MSEFILILIAGLIVLSVGIPFVEAYSRYKKAMNEEGDEDAKN